MHSPHAPLSAEVPVSGALPLPPTPINNANKMMSPPQTSQGTELQSSTGVPSVKSEITRLSSPAPGSVKNPLSRPEVLPGGKGDITLPEHPFPSVTAAPTPSGVCLFVCLHVRLFAHYGSTVWSYYAHGVGAFLNAL